LSGDVALWTGDAGGLAQWRAQASPGSRADLAADGSALRFDFAMEGHGAFAIARRERAFELPAHYVVAMRVRGEAQPAVLQLKLVDPSGQNVWWWRRRDFAPSRDGERVVFRRANLEFAWGPRSGGDPDRIGAIELAVASDTGAAGKLVIEDLRIEARAPSAETPQVRSARASSAAPGCEPEHLLDAGAQAGWRPEREDAQPWLELDLGAQNELGGLRVDFAGASAPACRLLASEDGTAWRELAHTARGSGAQRWLDTGEMEARFLRIELPPRSGAGIARVAVVPIELAVSPARYASAVARAAARGVFPRHLLGEGGYWALVGQEADTEKGLLGEDGALEVGAGAFTLEPFLEMDGRCLAWADAQTHPSLADACLPIPSLTWEVDGLRLRVTACASGAADRSALIARYALHNPGDAPRALRLWLAIRPFQVTPIWQGTDPPGAVAPISRIVRDGAHVRVNGDRVVMAVSRPDAFAAAPEAGCVREIFAGRPPAAQRADDPLGFAEAALAFDLELEPGGHESVVVALPLFAATPELPAGLARAEASAWGEAQLEAARGRWRARLADVPISLPRGAAPFEQSLRASLAWILVNREGPRIQPGPRRYRRSWIRDGALTGAALAEMRFADELRAFLRWYVQFQEPDGKVPCAVDAHGIDRAVEHDSHGQLVWGIVEHYRLTGDVAFLFELWPHALRAVDAIANLRAERTGEAFRGDARFGLLPESISHEGYASSPVHSYWDDFFAVRALADAVEAAAVLGDAAAAARIAPLRDAMRADVHASIRLAMAKHGIDFVPGSAELGDFDPTSTAIALDPCGEGERLPRAALEHTFERYWEELEARRSGERVADAYTPYEIRNAVALVRLGWKERALGLLEWLIGDQRLPGWREWPEVTTRDPRTPRFLGDLPHGWVASSYVRALRALIAYERDEDGVLVLAAGVPEAWVREAPGVQVRGLPTHFGVLDFALAAESETRVRARFGGACRPPGGAVLESPLVRPLRAALVDGREAPIEDGRRVALPELPGEVVLVY
jgi:hypothetical protein